MEGINRRSELSCIKQESRAERPGYSTLKQGLMGYEGADQQRLAEQGDPQRPSDVPHRRTLGVHISRSTNSSSKTWTS